MQTAQVIPRLAFPEGDGRKGIPLDRDSLTIGRLPDQDLVLAERCVSRHHAVLQRRDDSYLLVDQGSSHGTWVNGQRVQHVLLRDGDILQFGSPEALRIRFQVGSGDLETDPRGPADLLATVHLMSISQDRERAPVRQLEQLNFLLGAARKLNAGEATADILYALLQLSIQLTKVERGFVFLRRDGEMRFAVGLRSDGSMIHEDATVSRRAMQRAIESTHKFSVSDTLADLEAAAWDSVLSNSIRSIYCIPLRKRITRDGPERLLGLLYLDSQITAGHLSAIDHELLDTISVEAATLLDNALLAQAEKEAAHAAEELAIAARIHAGLMATDLPEVSFARLHAKAIPCKAIGGDFYDAVEFDNCLAVAIADVSGKGVPASIVAATLQGIIHAQLFSGQPLEQIADQLNRFLCSRGVGRYATMVLLKLYSDGNVEYVNCAHVRPLLVADGKVSTLEEANLMVGLIPEATYFKGTCALSPGTRIVLATDGVTEAENALEEQFGDERLQRTAIADRLEGILQQVNKFQAGHPAQDDCTLMEIEYVGLQ
jgi:phosphoserine phosphatase RsbU/P